MEEIEDEMIERKKSDDHDDDECDVDAHDIETKNYNIQEEEKCSTHNASSHTGFVDEQVKGFVDEQVKSLHKDVDIEYHHNDRYSHVDTNMETLYSSKEVKYSQRNESRDIDLDGIEGFDVGNKSVESLLYHSADSAQFHSVESAEPVDVDLKDNLSNIFNVGVQIVVNDKIVTPEDFNNDVSASSETLDTENNTKHNDSEVKLNGNISDPAVTVTTVCEALLKENGIKAREISELSSEEADTVVMKTFLISSDEYDATVTTMLEISPLPLDNDTIDNNNDVPHDQHSVVKTFEISSPRYDATITTTVEELISPDTDTNNVNTIEILPHESDDGVTKLIHNDDDEGKNEIRFQISSHDQESSTKQLNGTYSIDYEYDENINNIFVPRENTFHDNIDNVDDDNVDGVDGDDIDADNIDSNTVESDNVDGGNVDGGNVDGSNVDGGNVDGGNVDGDNVDGGNVDGDNVDGDNVDTDNLHDDNVDSDNIDTDNDQGNNFGVISIETDEDYLKTTDTLDIDHTVISVSPGSVSSIRKSYEELSYDFNLLAHTASHSDESAIDKTIDEHDIINDVLCEPVLSVSDGDTTYEDIDIAVSEVSSSEVDDSTDISHDTTIKIPDTVSHPDIISTSLGTVDTLKKSFEDFSCDFNSDVMKTNVNGNSDMIIEETIQHSHGIPDTYAEPDVKFPTEVNDGITQSYDILSRKDDITVSNIPTLETPSQISSGDSDHNTEETSSFETDITVQNVYSVLTEPDIVDGGIVDVIYNTETYKSTKTTNTIDTISSSEGDGTTEILCDVSPDESIEYVDATLDEQKANETTMKVTTQVSIASNKSFEILSIDSDIEASNKEKDVSTPTSDETLNESKEHDHTDIHTYIHDVDDNIQNGMTVNGDVLLNGGDVCVRKISDFSEHEADAIIEKTFEDLSTDAGKNILKISVPTIETDVSEKTYDILSIDAKVSDETNANENVPYTSDESIRRISDYSQHEADTIIHQTFEDLSNEAAKVLPKSSVSSLTSDTSEKAYDILSIDSKIPDKHDVQTDVTVDEKFAYLSLEIDGTISQPTNHVSANEDNNETIEAIPNINDTQEHDVVIEKTFDDISVEAKQVNNNILESNVTSATTYDILSIENGTSNEHCVIEQAHLNTDETFEHLTHANITADKSNTSNILESNINKTSSDEANMNVDETLQAVPHDPSVSKTSHELEIPEKTYDVYSLDDGTPKQTATASVVMTTEQVKNNDETFEHLAYKTNDVVLHSEDMQNDDETVPEVHNGVVEKTFDLVVENPTPITKLDILSDKSYQILSFENGTSTDDNVTKVVKLTDTVHVNTNETFEHVPNESNVDNINKTIEITNEIKDITKQILNISHQHDDEFIDIKKEEINIDPNPIISTEEINTDVAPKVSQDIYKQHIDKAPGVKTLAEIADIYDKATAIEINNIDATQQYVIDESLKYQRETSMFEIIEGGSSYVVNGNTVDIDLKEKKTHPVDIQNGVENNDCININIENSEQVKTISIDHSNETTKHKTGEMNDDVQDDDTVMNHEETNASSENSNVDNIKMKDENIITEKKLHYGPLDEYDVIEHDEIKNVVISGELPPRSSSFATFTLRIKNAFSPTTESKSKQDNLTKPVNNQKPKISVHVEETSNGEEIQVLTFSRSAIKSGGTNSKTNGDSDIDDDAFTDNADGHSIIRREHEVNHNGSNKDDDDTLPSSGGVKKRVEMFENNQETFGTAFALKRAPAKNDLEPSGHSGSNVVLAAPPTELKLTSKTLTLNKNALPTDRYPAILPDYPSDRRSLIVLEIYTTERTFVRGLEIATTIFKGKMEHSNLLDANEIYSIFSNIAQILELNTGVLHQIFERVSCWSDEQCIGDIFLTVKDEFNMYAEFCKNYDTGEDIIRQKKKKKDFEALLQECYNNPKCMIGQTLSSYLITIIQRLPRYILLLKDLIKRTPASHPDSKDLKDALLAMESKAAYINEQLKQSQCQKALEALQTQITGLKQYYTPDRTLVHEGPVCLLTGRKTYQGVLFNDILVFALKGENKQSVVELVLELKTVWIEDLGMLDPQTTKGDAIGVYTPDRPYRMYVGTIGEKKIWLQHLKATLTAILDHDSVAYESHKRDTSFHYKNGTIYEGPFISTKRHGNGKVTIPTVMTYEGAFEDDEKNGFGVARYYTGEVFEGFWKDDKQDGLGTFKYTTGDEISCEWRNGVKTGGCVITYKNGDKFTGNCVNDQIEGHGELICTNGFSYVGAWLKNKKHGAGQLKAPDGMEFVGQFARDKFHGNGEIIYPDGSVYKGEFEHGIRFGDGVFKDLDGGIYDGKWVDDKKNGRGKMTYANGDEYIGSWLMDIRHGTGKMTYAIGGYYRGNWESGLIQGTGIMELRDGSVYDGEFNAGMLCGFGTMKYKDGSRYVGDWLNNFPNGKGIWTKPKGWVCDGTWLNGTQNGSCSLRDPVNEYEYEGDWLNGIKEGVGTETRQGFTYSGAFLEDLYHGPGLETTPDGSKYDGTWHRGAKHGKGILKHANNLFEHQTWKHGRLIDSPMIFVPRERTPIQRWHQT